MDHKKVTLFNVPIILRNALKWDICSWNLEKWLEFLEKDQEIQRFLFRKGKQYCSKEPFWERKCDNIEMTLSEFFKNLEVDINEEDKNWLYFDYKHIGQWFSSKAESLNISWEEFGHPEKTAKDSTLWIGTKGAHTPCHMDTYGCNLVAQIFGRKEWYLFPPSETDHLKPTRYPYEESSVYSSLNFACGCSNTSEIKEIRRVILNPGDVLFVPRHWWHYVENISTAISINVWLPTVHDDISRLEESLVKYFVSAVCRSVEDSDKREILNPNEDDITFLEEKCNIEELSWCINKCYNTDLIHLKPKESAQSMEVPSISCNEFNNLLKSKCLSSKDLCDNYTNAKEGKYLRRDIINAFCHPEVISLVREKLLHSSK